MDAPLEDAVRAAQRWVFEFCVPSRAAVDPAALFRPKSWARRRTSQTWPKLHGNFAKVFPLDRDGRMIPTYG